VLVVVMATMAAAAELTIHQEQIPVAVAAVLATYMLSQAVVEHAVVGLM
jgi:hypothetical protein